MKKAKEKEKNTVRQAGHKLFKKNIFDRPRISSWHLKGQP